MCSILFSLSFEREVTKKREKQEYPVTHALVYMVYMLFKFPAGQAQVA